MFSSTDVLLIDNYDSFVFNLARYFEELGVVAKVVRNDCVTIEDIIAHSPGAIVLSPGPCTPNEAGICKELIRELHQTIPILGVCLGHQAIGSAFGAKIVQAPEPFHGRKSTIDLMSSLLFRGCPKKLTVGRYHSLIIDESTLEKEIRVTSRTHDGIIMSCEHTSAPLFGVQFHPESILSQNGHVLLKNFLEIAGLQVETRSPIGDMIVADVDTSNDFYHKPIDPHAIRPM